MSVRTELQTYELDGQPVKVLLDTASFQFITVYRGKEYTGDSYAQATDKAEQAHKRRMAEQKVQEAGITVGIAVDRTHTLNRRGRHYGGALPNVVLGKISERGRSSFSRKVLIRDAVSGAALDPIPADTTVYLPWTDETRERFLALQKAKEDAEAAFNQYERSLRFEQKGAGFYSEASRVVEQAVAIREKLEEPQKRLPAGAQS